MADDYGVAGVLRGVIRKSKTPSSDSTRSKNGRPLLLNAVITAAAVILTRSRMANKATWRLGTSL